LPFTRRDFLSRGALFVSMGVTAPTFLTSTARALAAQTACGGDSRRILLVVQLGGGNDSLNSFVPYADPTYYSVRPTLAIPEAEVLPVSAGIGFNPALAPLKELFDAQQLALVQGVGYPNPNRSHFRSTDIWTTAHPETIEEQGWLGRYLDAQCSGEDRRLRAVDIGTTVSQLFWTGQSIVPAISSIETFSLEADVAFPDDQTNQVETLKLLNSGTGSNDADDYIRRVATDAIATSDELQRVAASYRSTVEYPESEFGEGLKTIAKIVSGDLGTQIFHINRGGFDTHAAQANSHAGLLDDVAAGIQAFVRDLEAIGRADDLLIMTFSEFGRRVAQNASLGTDHGAAASLCLIGGGVTPGIVGAHPSLDDLDDGDLKYGIDFRAVYGAVLRDWLGADPAAIIGTKEIEPLELIRVPATAALTALAAD
jgi:uncharacterized protein (DUF1501 family)